MPPRSGLEQPVACFYQQPSPSKHPLPHPKTKYSIIKAPLDPSKGFHQKLPPKLKILDRIL